MKPRTINTPQILELSGIGRADVINDIGVPLRIELPGVGENLQDHPYCGKCQLERLARNIDGVHLPSGISYELDASLGHTSIDLLRDPAFASEQMRMKSVHRTIRMYRLLTH